MRGSSDRRKRRYEHLRRLHDDRHSCPCHSVWASISLRRRFSRPAINPTSSACAAGPPDFPLSSLAAPLRSMRWAMTESLLLWNQDSSCKKIDVDATDDAFAIKSGAHPGRHEARRDGSLAWRSPHQQDQPEQARSVARLIRAYSASQCDNAAPAVFTSWPRGIHY